MTVNGSIPEWDALMNDDSWTINAFSDKHVYRTNISSTGQIELKINDSNYTDNSGSLSVDIYQLP